MLVLTLKGYLSIWYSLRKAGADIVVESWVSEFLALSEIQPLTLPRVPDHCAVVNDKSDVFSKGAT